MADLFEDLVYTDEDVITFERGIPGFEQARKFVLTRMPAFEPFEWLVNVESRKLRFAVINPMLFRPDYNPPISQTHIDGLQLAKPEDVALYCIVTLQKDPMQTTANLMGPVIINRSKRLGKQIILDDGSYSVKEKILS